MFCKKHPTTKVSYVCGEPGCSQCYVEKELYGPEWHQSVKNRPEPVTFVPKWEISGAYWSYESRPWTEQDTRDLVEGK